jgi:hypothetical protein
MATLTATMACVDAADSVGGAVVATGNKVSESFGTPDGTANQLFTPPSILFASLELLAIEFRDVNGNYLGVVLKTNSSGSPTDTITLTAGKGPLIWRNGCGIAKPLTGNVTSWYVSPALATPGTLKVMAIC